MPEHLHFISLEEDFMQALDPVFASSGEERISFGENGWVQLPDKPFSLESMTDAIMGQALERFGGNKSKAAEFLGVSRYALHRWISGKS